ncbi:chaplin [Actinacidiphila acididurans]|uniref:Chaplin n=1 Tax=Actinacidiphila acididurans TaxID=2784346 RepID=A0ABS2TR25_9ACTN|nr:chaplin [Actinacidiphila acididurans]MBM9505780.1 chaplin [Actinacidiphila acididurans]
MKYSKIAAVAAGTMMAMGAAAPAFADAGAQGAAAQSPGVLSGNEVQAPIHVPVGLCGDTVDVVGLLNPSFGSTCLNASTTN